MKNIKFILLFLFMFNLFVCSGKQGGSVKSKPRVYERRLRDRLKALDLKNKFPECTICLDSLNKLESGLGKPTFLNCNHIFHSECLRNWLQRKAECPLCRQAVDQKIIDKHLSISNLNMLPQPSISRNNCLRKSFYASCALISVLVVCYVSVVFWHNSFVPAFRAKLSQVESY